MESRDPSETAVGVEAGGDLEGSRLIMDKSVCVRGANGLFIKALGVEHAALYSCGLRAHQCGAVLEILRTILRPYFELTVVNRQSLEMLLFLVGRCGIPACRAAEATIQVIVLDFEI